VLPDPSTADEHGVVGVGADLEPGTLLAAYRSGLFPMPAGRQGAMAWWSPDPRGILPLDGLIVSRSLRRSVRRFDVRVDTDFEGVIDACRTLPREGGWINRDIRDAYVQLHRLGWAHSVETWTTDGRMVGGLYGVAVGGLFAGESMFHVETDASKVALVALVDWLRDRGATLLDVQWRTEHLARLGAIEIPRSRYLALLRDAVEEASPVVPGPAITGADGSSP
jgi:leucyl/phenylalanyl-tRNA--protein transferase